MILKSFSVDCNKLFFVCCNLAFCVKVGKNNELHRGMEILFFFLLETAKFHTGSFLILKICITGSFLGILEMCIMLAAF
jgi:hypothetical protein